MQLEKAIQNLTYPSVERLMDELEVSRRTILRTMQSNLFGECVVAVDDLPAGVYVVRLSNASETLMVKFVKH